MRVVVLGAGAMGSLYGAYLSEYNEVIMIDKKPDRVDAINENGIIVVEEDGTERIFKNVKAYMIGEYTQKADLVIIFVKTPRTEEAIRINRKVFSENTPISVIPTDSIYTPVRKCNFTVENTRVGQVTDYDKLILELWTDGSISPSEGVSIGAKIMQEHLGLFVGLTDAAGGLEIMVEKEENQKEKALEMTIEELELSVRSFNCLKRAAINTVEELTNRSEEDMMKVRNLGINYSAISS